MKELLKLIRTCDIYYIPRHYINERFRLFNLTWAFKRPGDNNTLVYYYINEYGVRLSSLTGLHKKIINNPFKK